MTRPADRYIPVAAHPSTSLRFRTGFKVCGAVGARPDRTTFRSLLFSSSSCFNRRISVGNSPSYFFFQLKQVAWLIPALRQISATGMPSAP